MKSKEPDMMQTKTKQTKTKLQNNSGSTGNSRTTAHKETQGTGKDKVEHIDLNGQFSR